MHIDNSLQQELMARSAATGEPVEQLIQQLLRQGLSTGNQNRALHVTSPVNALIEGIYQEDTRVADLLTRGDFGLGTFNHLDGEMVVLDGHVYQLKSDGKAYEVAADTCTPYACVNFFTPDSQEAFEESLDYAGLIDLLTQMLPSANMIYAIRIEGDFDYIQTRSVPRQDCYKPLVEVTREQPEFEYRNISGVFNGYWTPTFMEALTVPGYHLHFLSADRTTGGHLLACQTRRFSVAIQHLSRLEVGLPVSLDYLTLEFTRDLSSDLVEAEQAREH